MGRARVIHYHGGPITPETCALRVWDRRHAFVSYVAPDQIDLAASVCQSFALDNGAFSLWRAGIATDWPGYYRWCADWLAHPGCDWAIIPDVIGGSEEENDALIDQWPHGLRGVPVWHLNESVARLVRLADQWPRIALGSAQAYARGNVQRCLERLGMTLPAICDTQGRPRVKLHGLVMLRPEYITAIPLASADSTNVARNIGLDAKWHGTYAPHTKEARCDVLVDRIEAHQAPHMLLTSHAQNVTQMHLDFEEDIA